MGQESILAAAARYTAAHNRVKDNPKKLVEAEKFSVEDYQAVSDECTKGMEEFNRAEETLFRAVNDFLATHENPIVSAAIRFCKASEAWIALPPNEHSARSKDWTPEGHAVVEEYFGARQALFDVVQKSQTRRFETRSEDKK